MDFAIAGKSKNQLSNPATRAGALRLGGHAAAQFAGSSPLPPVSSRKERTRSFNIAFRSEEQGFAELAERVSTLWGASGERADFLEIVAQEP